MRAAIYSRISLDRTGESISPERQEKLCRQFAEVRGWEVVTKPFRDIDKSGWKKGVQREGFDAMVEGARAGQFDVLMAYSLSRFGRQTIRLLDFAQEMRDRSVALATVTDNIDTSTAMGNLFFTILAAMAQMESEQISERVRSAHLVAAQEGKPGTGGHRCYGYTRDGEVIEEERDHILQAVKDLKSGTTLRQTTRNLNEAGSRTSTGSEWQPRSLTNLLRNPRLRGIRVHKSTSTKVAVESTGAWEPILTEAEQLSLFDNLSGNFSNSPERKKTRHLLTGLLVCGVCGKKMGYGPSFTDKSGKLITKYQCRKQPGSVACGRIAIVEGSLNQYVEDVVMEFGTYFAKSANEALTQATMTVGMLTAELEEQQQMLTELQAERFSTTSRMAKDTYDRLKGPTVERIAELEDSLAIASGRAERLSQAPKAIRGRPKLTGTVQEQRVQLAKMLDKIVINPSAVRGGNRFKHERVVFHWKSGDVSTSKDLDRLSAA
jgi:DNA invertase Pin-like site-specific DNA recombinase